MNYETIISIAALLLSLNGLRDKSKKELADLQTKVAVLENQLSSFMTSQIKHNDRSDEKLDEIKDCLHG